MKVLLRSRCTFLLSVIVVTGCSLKPEPSTIVASARFGIVQSDGSLLVTDTIPKRPGTCYAWELEIHPTASQVAIKEVFTLPVAGEWGDELPAGSNGVDRLSRIVSSDGMVKTEEILVTSKNKTVTLIQEYEVTAADPPGRYKIQLFVDGRLFEEFFFLVCEVNK